MREFSNANGRQNASYYKERVGTCLEHKNGFELKTEKMGHTEAQEIRQ